MPNPPKKIAIHHSRKGLSLLCAAVLSGGSFASSAQSFPTLLVEFVTGSQVRLSWTNTPDGLVLEETDALTPTSVWEPFAQSPTLANGQLSVIVDVIGLGRFFRLHSMQIDGLPPNPVSVAPAMPPGVATPLAEATDFLYAGPNPIQTGVASGTIEAKRVAVLRGKVKQRNNTPLSGVTISVLNHPEFGQTLSRLDGMFDLAVNGGGLLTLKYEKTGFCPVQRQLNAPWKDYVMAKDVVMLQMDPSVTSLALGTNSPMQVHQASMQTDADGARRATLIFMPGTCGSIVLANGATQDCSSISVRATEFTVGNNGPAAMPAALPSTSAYTYCVELSADEAIAQGATTVQFDRPVFTYVENFLGFPVGMDVPLGSYDHLRGVWIPEQNGKVIKVLRVTGGLADLDTDGDDLADSGAALAALSITDAERQRLAALYQPGQSLWRMAVTHFTPYDANMPLVPPSDAILPPFDPEPDQPLDNCCELSGNSVIESQDQILGEAIGVVGTSFALRYRSDRVPGYKAASTLEIPLSGTNLPASVQSIELEIEVAGRHFEQSFPPAPNQSTSFTWDGKDAYGRAIDGTQPITVNISYTYQGLYSRTTRFGAPPNGAVTVVRAREQVKFTRIASFFIGSLAPASDGLGGWTLSPHHAYDPKTMVLWRGDGRRESVSGKDAGGPIITRVAGKASTTGFGFSGDGGPALEAQVNPYGIAFGPDGSLYIACPQNIRVRRVAPDGTITTVAGNGTRCDSNTAPCGDGGAATNAQFNWPVAVAVGSDNTLYIADAGADRVRKVDTNGIITTLAGNGTDGFSGDNGPGPLAKLCDPVSLAVGPDGAVYIAGCERIRRVGPDGIITTVAGSGEPCVRPFCGDGGPATEAALNNTKSVAVGPDGSLYIAAGVVWRVTPDGIIRRIAGAGQSPDDGIPPTDATLGPNAVAVGPDSTVYMLTISGGNRLRWFRPDGVINTLAGPRFFTGPPNGDGGPARRAFIEPTENGLAVGPDGGLYFAEHYSRDIRRVAPLTDSFVGGELVIPARDGTELFFFTQSGQHLRTLDGLTGALRYQFSYDAAGQLATVADGSGNVTTVERDEKGVPTAIVGPFGQRTLLELDAEGHLSRVSNPNGEAVHLGYGAGGLLAAFVKPGGQTASYAYDSLGRLVSATDPSGATKTLTRSGSNKDHTVTVTSALGRVSTFQVALGTNHDLHLTTTDPAGAQSKVIVAQDGTWSSTASDGTTAMVALGADPRWGMRAPISSNIIVKTPSGLTRVTTMQRSVTLASTGAVLNLTALLDTVTINGRTFTNEYSASTRTLTSTWPSGRQQTYLLDNLARTVQGQLGNLEATRFSYDAQGRLASVTGGTAGDSRTTTFTYGPNGFLASVTDPLRRTLLLTNDLLGRITAATRPGGSTVVLDYDSHGNVTNVTRPGGPSHVFEYTARDEPFSYTAPAVGGQNSRATLTYNADRQPTLLELVDGKTNAWQYDSAGRLSVATLVSGQRTYGYDAASRLTSLSTSEGIDFTRTYDGWLSTGTIWTGAVTGSVTRTHDNEFRVNEIKVNGADPIAIQYDQDGLPVQIGSLVLTRNPALGLVTATKLGGLSDAITFDGFGDPAGYAASYESNELYSVTLSRDQLGRITGKSEKLDGTTHLFGYAYDLHGRLTEVRRDSVLIAQYSYDFNGNRLSFTGPNGTLNATYDAQDRLTQYADITYAYTPNGELLRKTDGTRITSYDYDGASKLVGVTLPDGTRIEYLLDGRGRRMGRKVNGVLGQAFLYQDRLRPIAELDGAAQVVARFVYGGNVPAYMIKGGATYRIITDPIGSPRLVVDVATGQVMQRIDYDEFGRVLLDSNPGFQPFGFAGGLYDPLSGLVHFGAREYDAEIGRWTTKDPVGVSSGLNVYAYVKNNPVNLIDPVGFGPELIAPRVQLNPSWDPGVQVDPVPHSPAPDARVAAPEPQPNPVGPSGAPPTPRPFEIVSHGPDQPLEVFEYGPSAEPAPPAEPLPSGPTPQPPCGGGFRLTPANSVPLVFAFLFGLQAGRELNQQYDLSGKAANLGVDYRDALLDIGVPEQDADVAGGLTSIIAGASLGAASVGIPFFTDLLDD